MKVRFDDLTQEEKEFITNGCGSKGGFLDPPDFMFEASCNHHDFNYWLGYREEDRKKADWQFYQAMKRDAERQSWYTRSWFYFLAWAYYRAVRWFGYQYFYYGPKERTREDLLAAMQEQGNG